MNNEDSCFVYNIHNHKRVQFNNYKTNNFSDFIERNNLIFIKTKIYYKVYDINQKDIFENILKKSELIAGFQFFQNNLILNINNNNKIYCVNIHSFKINKIVKNEQVYMMKTIMRHKNMFYKNFTFYNFINIFSRIFLNNLKDLDNKLFFRLENCWELTTKNVRLLFLGNQPNGILDDYRFNLNDLNDYKIIDMHKFDTYLSIKFNNNEGFIYNMDREKKLKLNDIN